MQWSTLPQMFDCFDACSRVISNQAKWLNASLIRRSAKFALFLGITFLSVNALSADVENSRSDSSTTERTKFTEPPKVVVPSTWSGSPIEHAVAVARAFASPKASIRMAALVDGLGASGVPIIETGGQIVGRATTARVWPE